jgi:SAM-dependent methyltransferase
MLDAQYWNSRYEQQQTGWDIGKPSTPLQTYIDQIDNKHLAILIPGCGNAYEAKYLMDKGFTNVTVVDIAPLVVQQLQHSLAEYMTKGLQIIEADFFELTDNYDLIMEQTFFCALDPTLREKYVVKMHHLLNPSGKIAGVLFDKAFTGGPPFGGSAAEYEALFTPYFYIRTMEKCYNSIPPRAGSEVFINLQKK